MSDAGRQLSDHQAALLDALIEGGVPVSMICRVMQISRSYVTKIRHSKGMLGNATFANQEALNAYTEGIIAEVRGRHNPWRRTK